jgi:hypothetical protein
MPKPVADQSCTEFDPPNFAAMADAAGIRPLVSGVGPQGEPEERPRPPASASPAAPLPLRPLLLRPSDPGRPDGRGIRVDDLAEVGDGIAAVLAQESSVVVDTVVARAEMAMSPSIAMARAKDFSVYMVNAGISRRADELFDLARTNLRR